MSTCINPSSSFFLTGGYGAKGGGATSWTGGNRMCEFLLCCADATSYRPSSASPRREYECGVGELATRRVGSRGRGMSRELHTLCFRGVSCFHGPSRGYGRGVRVKMKSFLSGNLHGSCGGRGIHALGALGAFESGQCSRAVERRFAVRMENLAENPDKRIARLLVKKQKTVPLPVFRDASGSPQHLSLFLREPEGRQCMLNTKALRKYEELSKDVFRCYLPKMEFLSFEVGPVIDLQVAAEEDSCQVDLLSCRFEGSDLVSSQNDRFSASLKNHLSWSSKQQEKHVLDLRLELDVALEVYTLPFTMLPISAVETPGTLILQALVDRLIPMFLDQLFADYRAWAEGYTSATEKR